MLVFGTHCCWEVCYVNDLQNHNILNGEHCISFKLATMCSKKLQFIPGPRRALREHRPPPRQNALSRNVNESEK